MSKYFVDRDIQNQFSNFLEAINTQYRVEYNKTNAGKIYTLEDISSREASSDLTAGTFSLLGGLGAAVLFASPFGIVIGAAAGLLVGSEAYNSLYKLGLCYNDKRNQLSFEDKEELEKYEERIKDLYLTARKVDNISLPLDRNYNYCGHAYPLNIETSDIESIKKAKEVLGEACEKHKKVIKDSSELTRQRIAFEKYLDVLENGIPNDTAGNDLENNKFSNSENITDNNAKLVSMITIAAAS